MLLLFSRTNVDILYIISYRKEIQLLITVHLQLFIFAKYYYINFINRDCETRHELILYQVSWPALAAYKKLYKSVYFHEACKS